MARLLVHRQEVKEQFPDGMVWVTLGEDTAGPELADKLTNVVGLLCGVRPGLTDPLIAGAELGRILGNQRMLLVIDDVWTSAQAEPFLIGGSNAVRLFTTRIRGVLPRSVEPVRVDEMAGSEAAQLLTAGTARVSEEVVAGLLRVTGRWPVLLALVNGVVRADVNANRHAEDSMREILYELHTTGPTALDITDATERHTAVARTIEVSLRRLTADQRNRYLELAVFGEDVAIPGSVLSRYWHATAGWSEFQTRRYCQRLADLALVSDYRRDPEQVVLHDVIRAYLREQTHHRRGELHRILIDAHRSLVPTEDGSSAWWQLPTEQTYLWAWLPTHLRAAGLDQELRTCLHHPKWLVGKLEHVGPAALDADLILSDDRLSRTLGAAVRQNAHVLGPLQPPNSLAATFATRLPHDGPTMALAEKLLTALTTPHLRAVTTLPDLPDPALVRVLTGHSGGVSALAVTPDRSWLTSADTTGKVRIWDPTTGTSRHTLTGHTSSVTALVVAPDRSWLASADTAGKVRIWDPTTGVTLRTLTGHTSSVSALVVAPDGSWLASADTAGKVQIWGATTGTALRTLTGHTSSVSALVVASDGSWLASADTARKVRIWDPTTGTTRCTLTDHFHEVRALVVAPDRSWLASADTAGKVQIWEVATGGLLRILSGHASSVSTLVVAPDGSWLASADTAGKVQIWGATTGTALRTHTGHTREVKALVVAPDGSWLASADTAGKVRIWDPHHRTARRTLTGHASSVSALVVAPDGSWLASADTAGEVRIWDAATGTAPHPFTRQTKRLRRIWDVATATGSARRTITDHVGDVTGLVLAPDGSWLAFVDMAGEVRTWDTTIGIFLRTLIGHASSVTALVLALDGYGLASADTAGEIRIWEVATGAALRTLTGHTREVRALVVAPGGSWLASADTAGEIRIWEVSTGALLRTLSGHASSVSALVVAPDGSWLASADTAGEGRIWEVAIHTTRHALPPRHTLPSRTLTTLTDRFSHVTGLVVAPDGSWLASADTGGHVRIWDPASGTTLRTFIGHTREVTAVAVASDGSWLASAGDDGEIRIWDPTTGAPLTSLRVAGRLSHLQAASTTIVAAGEHGLYFLTLCPGLHSR